MTDSLLIDNPIALKYLIDSPLYVLKSEKSSKSETPIESENPSTAISKNLKETLIGSFAKEILIVLSTELGNSTNEDFDLLNKTVSALKLTREDIGILELSKNNTSFNLDQIISELQPQKTITFGEIPNYKIKQLNELLDANQKILHCSSLKTLAEKQDVKLKWWNSIKSFLS